MRLRFLTVSAVFVVTSVWAQAQPAGPVATRSPADVYEAEFSSRFPLVSGVHQVRDWDLYTALVSGDVVRYATKVDRQIAKSFEQMVGKGYQTEQLEEQIRQDKRLLAAFAEHRARIAAMTVTADGETTETGCRHPLVYLAKEFRLVLGENRSGEDPLVTSTVAPKCARVGDSAVQITAGRSARFKCWTVDEVTSCGWRLPDMPPDLKQVIETAYPESIKARWRWRGVGGVTRVRYPGVHGGSLENDRVALTVPVGLALEFIDGAGRVRWTADSEGWTGSAPSRQSR
jgi:hypothetical protein